MSAICVVKEGESIVLGTDSRYVTADRKSVVSDSVEKIQEICADTFLATSGYSSVCDYQNAKACELGRSTQDIRDLSLALAETSRPILEEVAATLATGIELHPDIAAAALGEAVLHGAVLVGHSRGELGYVYMESRCAGGRVETRIEEYFGTARGMIITSASDSRYLARFRDDWRLFSDPPVTVVLGVIEKMKASSGAIGGQTQIVRLDSTGSHWIRRLPAELRMSACLRGIGTITAAISMTSPTLTITGTGFTINIDSTNGFKITDGSSNYLKMNSGGFTLSSASGGIGSFVASPSNFSANWTHTAGGSGTTTADFAVGATLHGTGLTAVINAFINIGSSAAGASFAFDCYAGLSVQWGGVSGTGITTTFQDLAGNTHQVVAGVIVS
jgi:hypothetical protein